MAEAGNKKCFVIMPFGEKETVDGKTIDFDEIYEYFIKNTVESLSIKCIRCDEIAKSGWIHGQMFESIHESDVAVVDITSLNPNVFYELGVRHTLARSVTVLLRRKGTKIPFNIQGFKFIEYDPESLRSVEEGKKKIAEFIQNGLRDRKNDSPVHEALSLRVDSVPRPIRETETFEYALRTAPAKRICLITGDLRDVKGIDVWVNSENTNMQMARHYDRSISGVIRYCGARKEFGRVVDDIIANELTSAVGNDANVPAGEVVVTGAGELLRTHGVKKIFHTAAVVGEPGQGYRPIEDIARCIRNALEKAEEEDFRSIDLKSILFPLMGTGTAKGDLEPKARELIGAAISYLKRHPQCRVDRVFFLTRSEQDLEACRHVLQGNADVVVP